jgi:hypothetical protein
MANLSRRSLLAALGLIPVGRVLRAQQQNPPPGFSTTVKVVNLFATVRDKQGKVVTDLTQNDFLLDEDGTPQTIRYFSRETDLPLTLGLLVDTSGSERNVLPDERSASFRFLDKVMREDKDNGFRDPFRFRGGIIAGPDELESRFAKVARPFGGGQPPTATPRGGGGGVEAEDIPAAAALWRRWHASLRRRLSGRGRDPEEAAGPQSSHRPLRRHG